MNTDLIIVMTTFSKPEIGEKLINELLEKKLAGCIQTIPIKSSYTWNGAICHESETLIFIKTKANLYAEIEKAILAIHDYTNPEIIAVPINQGSDNYTDWIKNSTQ